MKSILNNKKLLIIILLVGFVLSYSVFNIFNKSESNDVKKSENISNLAKETVSKKDDAKLGVIYLTFDDGPNSGTTEKILDILKDNDVKATFFITGTGPDNLIKREYDEGHKLALHTASHNYSYIYSSVDNYFADLKVVDNRVYKITGNHTNIIRFPGGSNNTISNRYSKKIMDKLTVEAINRGYLYFDWNISGGDAGGCRSSKCVYNNVVKHISKDKTNIILLHDTKKVTVNSLNNIIKYCKDQGYVFKTIDENTHQVKFK